MHVDLSDSDRYQVRMRGRWTRERKNGFGIFSWIVDFSGWKCITHTDMHRDDPYNTLFRYRWTCSATLNWMFDVSWILIFHRNNGLQSCRRQESERGDCVISYYSPLLMPCMCVCVWTYVCWTIWNQKSPIPFPAPQTKSCLFRRWLSSPVKHHSFCNLNGRQRSMTETFMS